ncbi:septum site-determining protein MinC [Oligella sp. HMSC05A10]|uniref:septum site-determining protein MinC n=1 Tax=Oligella sp. HMSC05A10 TaxID=1581112 RepID=UPI0008A330AC|nr:septum site-determining protein MinC [Oligella sp. HMSC05A10]OFS83879.1 septum site-determining protein MinC [Oligella sp. HMSC05A10]
MSNQTAPVLQLKGGFIYTLRLILQSNDIEQIKAALEDRLAKTGSLFLNEPLIIDVNEIEAPLAWAELLDFLNKKNLPVIGVSAQGELLEQAEGRGLYIIDVDNLPNREAPEPSPTTEAVVLESTATTTSVQDLPSREEAPTEASKPTMVLKRQLRSGQRVYARNADLIVIGAVSPGAEIIADGNIHVYGPLRGRAIAGARGNTAARIFTSHLDAELVAIAGIYRLIDEDFSPETHKKAAIIELEHESLLFHSGEDFN